MNPMETGPWPTTQELRDRIERLESAVRDVIAMLAAVKVVLMADTHAMRALRRTSADAVDDSRAQMEAALKAVKTTGHICVPSVWNEDYGQGGVEQPAPAEDVSVLDRAG